MCAHVCQICLQPTDLNRKLTRMAQMEEVNSHACTNNPLEQHHFLQIRVPLRCKFEFHLHKFGCSCGLHWREQLDLHFPEVLVPVPLVNQGESKRSCIVNIKCCLGFGTCIALSAGIFNPNAHLRQPSVCLGPDDDPHTNAESFKLQTIQIFNTKTHHIFTARTDIQISTNVSFLKCLLPEFDGARLTISLRSIGRCAYPSTNTLPLPRKPFIVGDTVVSIVRVLYTFSPWYESCMILS